VKIDDQQIAVSIARFVFKVNCYFLVFKMLFDISHAALTSGRDIQLILTPADPITSTLSLSSTAPASANVRNIVFVPVIFVFISREIQELLGRSAFFL